MAASPSGDAVTTKAGVIAGFFVSAVALANRPARLRHGAAVYHGRMDLLKLAALFFITAIAEIVGCYLPWLVLRQDRSPWLLLPAIPVIVAILAFNFLGDGLRDAADPYGV